MTIIIVKKAGKSCKTVLFASYWEREPTLEPTPRHNVAGSDEKAPGYKQKAAGFEEKAAGFGEKAAGFGEKAAGFGEKAAGFPSNTPLLCER
jgi:hypothetical protein